MISCDVGKFDEASLWLSRALKVDDQELEATLCLGDLYNRSANLEDAKKCYDKICSVVSYLKSSKLDDCDFPMCHLLVVISCFFSRSEQT